MKPLKILLVLIEPPLPFGNAASRWFYVLYNELLKRKHAVDVIVASGVPADIEKAKKDFKDHKNIQMFPFDHSRGFWGKVKTLLYPQRIHFSADFFSALDKLNPNNYDVVHIEQTWAGWTGLNFTHKALINVHHLQTIDLQYISTPTWKMWLMYRSWFKTEKYLLSKYPYVRSCSPRLVSYIEKWGKKKHIRVIPVGIDSSLYEYVPMEKRSKNNKTISVIGNMGWYPSYSAAERLLKEMWLKIKEQVPEAKLRIVGWGAKNAFGSYHGTNDIEVHENVPDIRPYFEQTAVMLYAPSRGSGMKIKILEAMAFGIPVVTTSEGSEGLNVQDMVHMGLSESNDGLVERTVKILNDIELQEVLRKNARTVVETQCSPQTTVDAVEDVYKIMLESSLP